MARNKNKKNIAQANKNIQDIAKGITDNMSTLYRNTYMSTPQQSSDLQNLTDRINSSMDKIVNKNLDTVGMPSVSKLYSRLPNNNGSREFLEDLKNMFDNGVVSDDLYGMFTSNRYLKELDNEIDTVCRYMPKLQEALDVQKDCVLSADHFSKDFLTFESAATGDTRTVFSERAKDLKKKYQLAKLAEEIYEDTSKYGERFIYRVPCDTAIGRLLANKPDAMTIAPYTGMSLHESEMDNSANNEMYMITMDKDNFNIYGESSVNAIVTESSTMSGIPNGKNVIAPVKSILSNNESVKIGLEICKSGIIESVVKDFDYAYKRRKSDESKSMAYIYEQSLHEAGQAKDIKAAGNLSFGKDKKDKRILTNDGLTLGNKKDDDIVKVTVPGCIVKKLPREHVVPIYVDDVCMGYYFFELRATDDTDAFLGFKNILGDPLTASRGDGKSIFNNVDNVRQDDTIRFIAGQLSQFIDKNFVNNNQDLAKEIYMILKYNDLFNTPSIDTIKVTFVPPEDMVHFFFKQDPITHRGISDIDKGLIPAKIYSSLYITNALATLTRSQDHRVYYVKQTVDTNIAQTLLNTINQIKQSNFGIRQFQNINNILNITGRFNDYVIPTGASGESPIQFEIVPGQDVKTPTELMEQLEGMAINSTGIPIEIIQARESIDYAIQLTMSSSKVLRFCYKRQELFEDKLCELVNPIYNYEYGDSIILSVKLPPPAFINITNTNQLVDNTRNFVQNIADIQMANEEDERLKNIYINELFKEYMGTQLDVSRHENILNRCKILAKAETDESHASGGESDY